MPFWSPEHPSGELRRRFSAADIPLYEVSSWVGERHLGSYGVQDPGDVTISLGLVFGPRDPTSRRPRIAVDVSTRHFSSVDVGDDRVAMAHAYGRPLDGADHVASRSIPLDGSLLEVRCVRLGDLVWMQGTAGAFGISILTTVDPTHLALQSVVDLTPFFA